MSSKSMLRKLTNWAVMAFVAAVLYVFITPSYRQTEPSISGKKAEDFPSPSREGRLDSLSLEEKSSFSIFGNSGFIVGRKARNESLSFLA